MGVETPGFLAFPTIVVTFVNHSVLVFAAKVTGRFRKSGLPG